jgi:hypothetical protein
VTSNILATARPSSRIIRQYNIVEQFKKENITSIINLQERFEHRHCGDGIDNESGFSYKPEEFMNDSSRYTL